MKYDYTMKYRLQNVCMLHYHVSIEPRPANGNTCSLSTCNGKHHTHVFAKILDDRLKEKLKPCPLFSLSCVSVSPSKNGLHQIFGQFLWNLSKGTGDY